MAERRNRPGSRGGSPSGSPRGRGTGQRAAGPDGRGRRGPSSEPRSRRGDTAFGEPRSRRGDTASSEPRSRRGDTAFGEPRSRRGDTASSEPRSRRGNTAFGEPRSRTGNSAFGEPRSRTGNSASSESAGHRGPAGERTPRRAESSNRGFSRGRTADRSADTAPRSGFRGPGAGRGATSPAARPNNEAEQNSALVVGRHPVLEALKSGRSINKILVSDTAEGGSLTEIMGKAKAAGVVVQRVPKAHLDGLVETGNHQGIVAYTAAHDYVELEEIVAKDTGHDPLVLLLDEVADPYNLGAVLRTAEATGVQGVVIPKRRAVPLTETVGKAAAGAMEYVPVARVANLVQAMETLKAAGYWIVGTDVEGAKPYTEVPYKGPIAIVIGAEDKGLSRLVRERCDYLVSLPMLGQLQSLNASVATGVLLYEVVRQRA